MKTVVSAIEAEGVRESSKCGYLYTAPGRCGDALTIDVTQLPRSHRG